MNTLVKPKTDSQKKAEVSDTQQKDENLVKVVKVVTFDDNNPKYGDLNQRIKTYQPPKGLKF